MKNYEKILQNMLWERKFSTMSKNKNKKNLHYIWLSRGLLGCDIL
jgi:hypothetical protein